MIEGLVFVGVMTLAVWGMLILPLAFLAWLDRRDK